MRSLLFASFLLWARTIVDSYRFVSAGTPAGNAFTIAAFTSDNASTTLISAGAVGDIYVIYVKWEGTSTDLTSIQADTSGTATLRGSQINHANGDLHCRFATIVATTAGAENITGTWTGSPAFRDWMTWRISATGTKAYDINTGTSGTGTSVSIGSFSSVTQNGIVLTGVGPYGSTTFSSQQVGGNAASNTRTVSGSATQGWDYLHTAQLSSANATATMGTSREWVGSVIGLSAQ